MESHSAAPSSLLVKISIWQQQLRAKLIDLVRQARAEKSLGPVLFMLLIAFAYGVVHAAGPGHGKAVAMSFMLSQDPSLPTGLGFGALIALFHGLSGTLCVLALYYVLKMSVSGGMETISQVTQVVSFSLIAVLGLGILLKNISALISGRRGASDLSGEPEKKSRKVYWGWAGALGMIPCPGVVIVLLFFLSMGLLGLGVLMAAAISLGMAVTISVVVLAVVSAKAKARKFLFSGREVIMEPIVGMISGLAATLLGSLFLASAIRMGPFGFSP